jgi:hypothetical protein
MNEYERGPLSLLHAHRPGDPTPAWTATNTAHPGAAA